MPSVMVCWMEARVLTVWVATPRFTTTCRYSRSAPVVEVASSPTADAFSPSYVPVPAQPAVAGRHEGTRDRAVDQGRAVEQHDHRTVVARYGRRAGQLGQAQYQLVAPVGQFVDGQFGLVGADDRLVELGHLGRGRVDLSCDRVELLARR